MNEQEKQKASSLKAAAKLQGDSIDAMMKALNEANESIIGMEAKVRTTTKSLYFVIHCDNYCRERRCCHLLQSMLPNATKQCL
jgi:hypothetical protein